MLMGGECVRTSESVFELWRGFQLRKADSRFDSISIRLMLQEDGIN